MQIIFCFSENIEIFALYLCIIFVDGHAVCDMNDGLGDRACRVTAAVGCDLAQLTILVESVNCVICNDGIG